MFAVFGTIFSDIGTFDWIIFSSGRSSLRYYALLQVLTHFFILNQSNAKISQKLVEIATTSSTQDLSNQWSWYHILKRTQYPCPQTSLFHFGGARSKSLIKGRCYIIYICSPLDPPTNCQKFYIKMRNLKVLKSGCSFKVLECQILLGQILRPFLISFKGLYPITKQANLSIIFKFTLNMELHSSQLFTIFGQGMGKNQCQIQLQSTALTEQIVTVKVF